jgi:hypothetical protein
MKPNNQIANKKTLLICHVGIEVVRMFYALQEN